ncbi:small ribosomal subunit protein mS25-like [Brevipalpus obovatus]|uniref:small ribosomal subunit protein mS25-like n=1 Tax=Brevipalpus obovatus TaxID=246614 RepID=UPI003D9E0D9D
MPFLLGSGPIRRTLRYLKAGDLIFKDRVKIMEVHYNFYYRRFALSHLTNFMKVHSGMIEFHYWDIPQIQYANPNVQIVRFNEMMPNPFIRCWFEDGKDIIFDCFAKDRKSILSQLIKVLGKTKDRIKQEQKLAKSLEEYRNLACFGFNQETFCYCEIPGHVPCPGTCPLPKRMLGKYTIYKTELLESWEKDLDAEYPSQKQLESVHQWYPLAPKPGLRYQEGIDKPHLREYGKTMGHDISPSESYYEWVDRNKPLVEDEGEK